MDTGRLVELLAGTPLGEDLDPEDIRRLAEAGEVRQVPQGEVLIEEERRGSALMVVLEGEVEVLKSHGKGDLHRLGTLGQGTVLGEVGLVLRRPASATVRTLRPSSLFVLSRDRFRELASVQEGAAAAFSLAIAKVLATRLQRMNQEVVALCERYEELLADPGPSEKPARAAEFARFKEKLLSEWNF